jgi:hypothetical protein
LDSISIVICIVIRVPSTSTFGSERGLVAFGAGEEAALRRNAWWRMFRRTFRRMEW